jgi:hypothetical protein
MPAADPWRQLQLCGAVSNSSWFSFVIPSSSPNVILHHLILMTCGQYVIVSCLFPYRSLKTIYSADVFIWGSPWSCIDVVCVLVACRYMIEFPPCSCSLYLGEVMSCETDVRGEPNFLYIITLQTTKKTSIPL